MENVPGNVAPCDTERVLINRAKKAHKETTEAAERALQVAVTTTEVARDTLVELHRQGQQLEITDEGVTQIAHEVKEASSLLRFMRKFCCVALATSCCSCVDSDTRRDATRKSRVKQMQQQRHQMACEAASQGAVKQKQVDELIRKAHTGEDDAPRQELLGEGGTIRAQRARQAEEERIGWGLPEADQGELRCETRKQAQFLDRISAAVEALTIISKSMHEELEEQAPRLDRLNERTEAAQDELHAVQWDAARLAGPRHAAAGGGGTGSVERQTAAAAVATAARYSAAQAATTARPA